MLLNFFYKGISPFLDPVTREKVLWSCVKIHAYFLLIARFAEQIRFNPNLFELLPKEQLTTDLGGEYDFEFEPETYWKQILE